MTRPTVLIADDDEQVRKALGRVARRCGFEVLLAEDGVEALAICRTEVPDIIVTDLHMPRLGGARLVAMLRKMEHTSNQPIMVVTADESRATKLRLLEAGADDFLAKPVDRDEFQARLIAQGRRSELAVNLKVVTGQRDDAMKALEARTAELERLTFGLIEALEQANTMNDTDTGNHIRRVSEYSKMLAAKAGCDEEFVETVYRYASLHDVGKVGIPDAILKKPGKLTHDEFEQIKAHTLIGAEIIRSAGLPQTAINIPLCHHEKWNGQGYPRGLAGENIPLEARIVAVADVYDALRAKRCYKDAFTAEKTRSILLNDSGSHFDPRLIELAMENFDEMEAILATYSDEETKLDVDEAWG
jgi:putative two-component system response regulator